MDETYEQQLHHLFDVSMLNEKGLREYVKILRQQVSQLKCDMIDVEGEIQELKLKMVNKK